MNFQKYDYVYLDTIVHHEGEHGQGGCHGVCLIAESHSDRVVFWDSSLHDFHPDENEWVCKELRKELDQAFEEWGLDKSSLDYSSDCIHDWEFIQHVEELGKTG